MHTIQKQIIKELLFFPHGKFNQLNTTDLTSDHFSFHINQLLKDGLIEKIEKTYCLTEKGKIFAEKLDVKTLTITDQPVLGVSLMISKVENGETFLLLEERLYEPNKGKMGFHSEKVRFGEKMTDAATRCLKTETDLDGKLTFAGTIRMVRNTGLKPQFDIVLYYFKVSDLSGTLFETTDWGKNHWVSIEEANKSVNTFPDFPKDLSHFNDTNIFFEERITDN